MFPELPSTLVLPGKFHPLGEENLMTEVRLMCKAGRTEDGALAAAHIQDRGAPLELCGASIPKAIVRAAVVIAREHFDECRERSRDGTPAVDEIGDDGDC